MTKKTKLRDSARGRECQIRIPGVCSGNPETTVLCHLPGGGMGRKQPDLFAAFGCSECHACADGHILPRPFPEHVIRRYLLDGVIRTQQIWLDEGLIEIK